MQKTFLIICSMLLFMVNAFAQDSILLRMHYLPDSKYRQTVSRKIHLEVFYSGADSVLKKVQEKGIVNPTITDKNTEMTLLTTTYKPDQYNKLPIRLSFLEVDGKNETDNMLKGTKLYGKVEEGKMPVLDSVTSDIADLNFKKALLQNIQAIFSQVSFPPKKMALGDVYVLSTPINVPIGGMNLKMKIDTKYTLSSLTESMANFDLAMKCALDIGQEDGNSSGTGEGSGVMIYDRVHEFAVRNQLDYTMELTFVKAPLTIRAILKQFSVHQYSIETKKAN